MVAGHTHDSDSHGGSSGFGWELLDSIMLGCAMVVAGILAELLYKSWRARSERVRFDLTPQGRAAAAGAPGPVDAFPEDMDRPEAAGTQ